MSKQKRTPWFPVSTPPERVGVYERVICDGANVVFQHWNGRWWGQYDINVVGAHAVRSRRSYHQSGKWRSLAEDPNKKP